MSEMKLSFTERPYGGNNARPRPEFHLDRESKLLVVATPWGPRNIARKTIDLITDYYTMAKADKEATSPFPRLSCLSYEANHLRTAVMLANDALYNDENKTEYKAGVELFAASFNENELIWVQVGQPHLFLSRGNGLMIPLGSTIDLAADLSSAGEMLPSLPQHILGIESTLNLSVNNFRAQPGDRLVLLSQSAPPSSLYMMKRDELTVENITRTLANQDPNTAFWVGVLDLPHEAESVELSA
jgi:hypothetical protein